MRVIRLIIFLSIIAIPLYGFEFEAGRTLGMGKTVLFSTPSASDFLSCPTATPDTGQILLESGYQNQYELSELNKLYAAAGYRYRGIFCGIGLSQFGKKDYYIDRLMRGVVGFKYRRFALGFIIDGKSVEFGRELGTYRTSAFGIGGGVNFNHGYLSIIINNINKPKLSEKATAKNSIYEIRGEILGISKFSLTGRIALEENEKPQVSIGQYIRIAGQYALYWGLADNPVTYGGGAELNYHGMIINYSTRYHPVLGFSHNISIGYGLKSGK
jgi:hypothetical protein